jgi:hypothetical protein
MERSRSGGCFCGHVRYRAGAAATEATCCHCSICRRTSGAPFVAWFTVPAASFQVVAGDPSEHQSSVHGTRTFCPRCGTPLTFRSSHTPGEIDVTTCSLDDPEAVPPADHTWTSARLSWVKLADGVPTFSGARETKTRPSQGKPAPAARKTPRRRPR